MKTNILLGMILAAVAGSGAMAEAGKPPEKWFIVEEAVNTNASFMLRVDVDRSDRIYAEGQTMTVSVRADRDCYVYLLYYGASNNVACLFPNKYQTDNLIHAETTVAIPTAKSDFRLVAQPPFGTEVLQVVATTKPIDLLKDCKFQEAQITPVQAGQLKDMVVELKQSKPAEWAEARIQINTCKSGAEVSQQNQTRHRRIAVCIGISEYKSTRVPQLSVSHQDAERVADALRQSCGVDEVILLTNSQATREAIRQAIFKQLVEKTNPGDEIFLYFSCHGGRCADTTGTKADGLAKYLVPFDGEPGKPETMILDSEFARWIRELDGRQIGIILDNCYSGGMAKGERTQGIKGIGGPQGKGDAPSLFLVDELHHAKAIGQSGVELLAACEGNQIAWEMPTENDGSVLTHYLLKSIEDPKTDSNGDKHISLGEVYSATKGPIQDYVRKTFSTDQTPVLVDQAKDSVYLKP